MIFAITDAQALERFRMMRWCRDGEPASPVCGIPVSTPRHRDHRRRIALRIDRPLLRSYMT